MKKLLIIGGALVILILVIVVSLVNRGPDAVLYDGKSLRNWAVQLTWGDEASKRDAAAEFHALGSKAVPGLASLLRTRDSFVRRGIWAAAAKMPARIQNAIGRRFPPPDAARIRSAAARSLSLIGPDAKDAVSALALMLRKDDAQGRFEAALALGTIGGAGTDELVGGSESNDSNVRYASICGLGNLHSCDEVVVLALLKASADPAAGVAVTAGGILSRTGTNALPVVIRALLSPRAETRRAATRALGGIGAPREEIVPFYLKMLKDSDSGCRLLAAQGLDASVVPNPTMIAGLVAAVDDADINVRVAAIRGLQHGHRMAARAVPELAGCLDDSSPLVRQCAAQALGAIGTPAKSVLPRLAQAADDKEEMVRAAATGAIAKIEERDVPK